ncbi:hypothetical protein quinque_010090 [Culex quinquefasciatus]
MTTLRPRENTFKVDLSVFPKRPSFEEIHSFTAQDAVDQHNERHEIEVNKVKYKVRLQMDDSSVEVKIHDLSENVRNEDIVAFLRQYGDVHCIKDLVWGDSFAYKGVSSGIRVAKMTLKKDIKSFVTIQQEQTLITYRGQRRTCRHCGRISHPGMTCTDNKKLEGQKNALDERLVSLHSLLSSSYAIVVDKGTEKPNDVPTPSAPQTPLCPISSRVTDEVEQFFTLAQTASSSPTQEEDVQMEAEDDPIVKDQSTQQTSEDGQPEDNVTDSATMFKVPALPLSTNTVQSGISETDESSSDGSGFQGVKPKKPRGRPKKLKTKT